VASSPRQQKPVEQKAEDSVEQELGDMVAEKLRKEKEMAAAKAETERCEAEMIRYELAKDRYHAAGRLNVARRLSMDAEIEKAKGNAREAERLLSRAMDRCRELIDRYPDTEEALDATQILAGKTVPNRPLPPVPVLPKGVTANEEELVVKPKPVPAPNPPAGPSRAVFVRGYTLPNGTRVAPHYVIVAPAP
jgi:hypothetical protein